MNHSQRLLLSNLAWSTEARQRDPQFFEHLSEGQQPRILWIGCADSRVPADRITNCQPGELFVHRNIANLFAADDANTGSVLEYAVKVLQIENIVVCGHSHCGGVRAALSPSSAALPMVNQRIAGLRELAVRHAGELNAITDFERRVDRLAELNVISQVEALRRSSVVLEAPQPPQVDGWLFDLRDGLLKPLTGGDLQAAA